MPEDSGYREIELLWHEYKALPFPESVVGEEINGHCLVSLDSFAAGCIDTFLGRAGQLDFERMRVLEKCFRGLQDVTERLDGSTREYFLRLTRLANLVLSYLNRRDRPRQ